MKTYKEKIGVGLSTLIVGIAMYYVSISQIQTIKVNVGISPRAVPLMLSKFTIILALILIIQGAFVYLKGKKSSSNSTEDIHFYMFPFIIYLIMWLYALLLGGLGYFVASLFCLPLVIYLLKEKRIKNYIILAIVILVVFLAFGLGLNIPLSRLGLLI